MWQSRFGRRARMGRPDKPRPSDQGVAEAAKVSRLKNQHIASIYATG